MRRLRTLNLLTPQDSVATFTVTGAWRSWLSRWPVKPEAAGSSPVAPAFFSLFLWALLKGRNSRSQLCSWASRICRFPSCCLSRPKCRRCRVYLLQPRPPCQLGLSRSARSNRRCRRTRRKKHLHSPAQLGTRMRRIKMSVLGRNTERVSGRVLAWAEGDAKGMGKTNLAMRARETLTDWPSHASFSAI